MRVLYEGATLLDTAAIYAIFDSRDQLHATAREYFEANRTSAGTQWFAVDTTSHETYTRVRYDLGHEKALSAFDLVRGAGVKMLRFQPEDEATALDTLRKYSDQALSFQDALCGAVMKRVGILNVFTFDSDFWTMGFVVVPGYTHVRR